MMSSPSADDDNNQQQIVNNKYPYYQGIALYKWREASFSLLVHWGLDDPASTWSELKQTLVSTALSHCPNRFIFKQFVKED